MIYLLYLNPTERQLWGRNDQGWQRLEGEPEGHVWVVADLAEESFAEIKTPRLFGRDRSSYIARQLATRYPDTPYRAFLTPKQEGGLVGKIAPTRHVLYGIEAAERLNTELDATPQLITGVWPISLLMARLGQDKELPANLFIVMPRPGTLRIVFLKNRTPMLTRLTLTPNQIGAQIEEISRTLRHLENTQILPRNRQTLAVLLLGDPDGYEAPLGAANLKLISLRRWSELPPDDWRFPLFDLTVKSPAGQVAPLTRRAGYLAARLSKTARVLAAVVLIAGLAAAISNLWAVFDVLKATRTVTASIQELNTRIAEVDQDIGKFGVEPDTVRKAIALENDEIRTVPSMEKHFQIIAGVLASDPNLRLTDLQWHLLAPAALPCSIAPAADPAAAGTEITEAESAARKVELSIELSVPETYGPRDRALTLRNVSIQLLASDGLKLWQDATRDLARESLRGGSTSGTATKLSWCMTLPGNTSVADLPAGIVKP